MVLEEAHKSKFLIHPGATKLNIDLKLSQLWPYMNRDIASFVEWCLTCRKVKAEH